MGNGLRRAFAIKDMRFGMGHFERSDGTGCCCVRWRLQPLLGGAGESLGYDRWLKVNTGNIALFRQGLMLYEYSQLVG